MASQDLIVPLSVGMARSLDLKLVTMGLMMARDVTMFVQECSQDIIALKAIRMERLFVKQSVETK